MNPKSLVTGGAGFIGAHVVNELVALGHDVLVLDDLSGGFMENVNPKAKFVKEVLPIQNWLKKCFLKISLITFIIWLLMQLKG